MTPALLTLTEAEAKAVAESIRKMIDLHGGRHPSVLTAAFPNALRKTEEALGMRKSTVFDAMAPVTITAKEWAVLTEKAAWADHLGRNGLAEWDRFDEVTLKYRAGD